MTCVPPLERRGRIDAYIQAGGASTTSMERATSSNPILSGEITFESQVILRGSFGRPKILAGLLKVSGQRTQLAYLRGLGLGEDWEACLARHERRQTEH